MIVCKIYIKIICRPKVIRFLPLRNMEFTTILKGAESKDIKSRVLKLGGALLTHVTENVAAVFALQGKI